VLREAEAVVGQSQAVEHELGQLHRPA
jgi:hypothetical protein